MSLSTISNFVLFKSIKNLSLLEGNKKDRKIYWRNQSSLAFAAAFAATTFLIAKH